MRDEQPFSAHLPLRSTRYVALAAMLAQMLAAQAAAAQPVAPGSTPSGPNVAAPPVASAAEPAPPAGAPGSEPPAGPAPAELAPPSTDAGAPPPPSPAADASAAPPTVATSPVPPSPPTTPALAPAPPPWSGPSPFWFGPPPLSQGPLPPPAPETDPLLPSGIALAVLGALGIVGGAVAYGEGASGGDELCGLSGCVRRPDHEMQLGGVGLIAGGSALLALSIPVMAVGATGEPPIRQNDAMMTAGVVITGLAASSVVGGLGLLAAQSESVQPFDNRSEVAGAAVPMLIGGAALLGLGIPLWAAGGEDWEAPTVRDPDEPIGPGEAGLPVGQKVERSPAMKYTGMVLTVFAGAGLVAGTASMIAAEDAQSSCRECDFAGMGETIAGAFFFGGAGLLAVVGIPLWAVGASETLVATEALAAPAAPAERAALVPTLRLGIGSIELEGRF